MPTPRRSHLLDCAKEYSAIVDLSPKLVISPQKGAGSTMKLERDYTGERLARIKILFDEANRTTAKLTPTDRPIRRQLVGQLDQMLRELGQPDFRRKS